MSALENRRGSGGLACSNVAATTGWGPLVISRVIRALNWVIRTLS